LSNLNAQYLLHRDLKQDHYKIEVENMENEFFNSPKDGQSRKVYYDCRMNLSDGNIDLIYSCGFLSSYKRELLELHFYHLIRME
jgi:hypothetical protein